MPRNAVIEIETGENSMRFEISEWKGHWPTRIRLFQPFQESTQLSGDGLFHVLGTTSSGRPANVAWRLGSKPKNSRSSGGLQVRIISADVNYYKKTAEHTPGNRRGTEDRIEVGPKWCHDHK